MAVYLRLTLGSSKSMFHAIRTTSICSHRNLSYSEFFYCRDSHESTLTPSVLGSPVAGLYRFNTHRGFAKQRKQQKKGKVREEEEEEEELEEEDEDEEEELEEEEDEVDFGTKTKDAAQTQMKAAIDALSRELTKLRTGRASLGMLDHIMVEHYGVKKPLNRMAVVSVLDSKTLSITPHDANTLSELEKAIISSPLGINPRVDNQRLLAPIPPLTKEHIEAVIKVVTKSCEDVKQSIRRARQKALDTFKKAAAPKKKDKEDTFKKAAASKKKDKDKLVLGVSEDDIKRFEKEIDDLTKKFIKTAEDVCKAKEKHIRGG